jgi:DNA-binding transcriptional MerR regulator
VDRSVGGVKKDREARREAEIALQREVEKTAAALAQEARDLRRMAEDLPFSSRRLKVPLESLASRLEVASDGLSNELRSDVDTGSTRLLVRFARGSWIVGFAGLSLLGPGVAEGVASTVTEHLADRQTTTEATLDRLESRLDELEALPVDDAADAGSVPVAITADSHTYSGKQAAEIVGISYRQLDYWARTDLIRPSVVDAAGSGSRRQFTYRDLIEMKIVKSLLDAGIKLESVRVAFDYLRDELGEDIASARLVIGGGKAILVRSDDELVDILQSGQMAMTSVLSVDGVVADVDAAIRLSDATD